ncbi:response regulator transcription factor [Pararhizobium sp. BT-229]|uniref:response regulator transcription factor n=1 Tax=Pararhizobium sp. BT-229 TaxID=2986923 RepID=UPI0021F6CB3A|nr:response regulator transcription factor [Pararhizobium sp. BT-229]MCV9966745.1 response regulator transcription factor [Pararhizobium sp. BT-229]
MKASVSESSKVPIVSLVDDDSDVREAMGNLLDSVGIESLAFASAQEFLSATLPDRPGCFVLDVRMPGLSGLDLQHHLTSKGIDTPIVFLTAHGDIAMSVDAMKAGALDFLTKPVRDQTFLDAVLKAIATDRVRREQAAMSRLHADRYKALTARERQVMRLVVGGALNKQIAFDLGISEVTVKLHRSSMMKKMQVNSVPHLVGAWHTLPDDLKMSDG